MCINKDDINVIMQYDNGRTVITTKELLFFAETYLSRTKSMLCTNMHSIYIKRTKIDRATRNKVIDFNTCSFGSCINHRGW